MTATTMTITEAAATIQPRDRSSATTTMSAATATATTTTISSSTSTLSSTPSTALRHHKAQGKYPDVHDVHDADEALDAPIVADRWSFGSSTSASASSNNNNNNNSSSNSLRPLTSSHVARSASSGENSGDTAIVNNISNNDGNNINANHNSFNLQGSSNNNKHVKRDEVPRPSRRQASIRYSITSSSYEQVLDQLEEAIDEEDYDCDDDTDDKDDCDTLTNDDSRERTPHATMRGTRDARHSANASANARSLVTPPNRPTLATRPPSYRVNSTTPQQPKRRGSNVTLPQYDSTWSIQSAVSELTLPVELTLMDEQDTSFDDSDHHHQQYQQQQQQQRSSALHRRLRALEIRQESINDLTINLPSNHQPRQHRDATDSDTGTEETNSDANRWNPRHPIARPRPLSKPERKRTSG